MIFWDTSALLKAYVNEAGSRTVRTIIRRLGTQTIVTNHVALEVLAGLGRSLRAGGVTPHVYLQSRRTFLRRYSDTFRVVDVKAPVVWRAFTMAITHRKTSAGAMDLLHVASAVELQIVHGHQPLVMVSSDRGLLALAKASGLATFDPETEPLRRLTAFFRRASRN